MEAMETGTRAVPRDDPGLVLAARYHLVRSRTESLCEPLEVEDYALQSMPSCSPAKWHLAHTTWFFETFVLAKTPHYVPYDPRFSYLFNSYYESVGRMFPRPQRGLLSRPTVTQIFDYRRVVDDWMHELLIGGRIDEETLELVELGLQHEQQHQELILMDVKHGFFTNPLGPVYRPVVLDDLTPERVSGRPWVEFSGGIETLGVDGPGFAFDNERPSHRVFLEPFALARAPVSNAEYLEFIEDGGYRRPELWLSNGWTRVQAEGWTAPLYWRTAEDGWEQFTLSGWRALDPREPVCHVSYFEADAYARWRGHRLPTEAEWECAARALPVRGNFVESGRYHPMASPSTDDLVQVFGDVWEWTASAYAPYPGYRPPAGALGEYNGKFMCSQLVLRGGSCITPASHVRSTYRNFFYPEDRWPVSGIRLARTA